MARPKAPIDLEMVEKLASIQCTEAEISAIIGVSQQTLTRRKALEPEIAEAIERGRADGRASLRRSQWKTALGGNATMLIWLGKQHLGQADRPEQKATVEAEHDEAAELLRDAEAQRPSLRRVK